MFKSEKEWFAMGMNDAKKLIPMRYPKVKPYRAGYQAGIDIEFERYKNISLRELEKDMDWEDDVTPFS